MEIDYGEQAAATAMSQSETPQHNKVTRTLQRLHLIRDPKDIAEWRTAIVKVSFGQTTSKRCPSINRVAADIGDSHTNTHTHTHIYDLCLFVWAYVFSLRWLERSCGLPWSPAPSCTTERCGIRPPSAWMSPSRTSASIYRLIESMTSCSARM